MSVWTRRLRNLFEGTGRLAALATAFAVAETAVILPLALLIQHVFDDLIPSHDTTGIVVTGAIVLALYLAGAGLALMNHMLASRTIKRTTAALRRRLLARIYLLPRSWHDRHGAGHVHSLVVQDTDRVELMVEDFVSKLYPAAILGIALAVLGLVLSPLLFALAFAGVSIGAVLARLTGKRFRSRVRAWANALERYSTATQQSLRAITLTKAHGAERYELTRRGEEVDTVAEAARALVWAKGAYVVIQSTLSAVAGSLVLVGGGIAVADGSMTLGELLSFYAVMALFLRQLSAVAQGVPSVVIGLESLARLDEVLEADEGDPYHGQRRIELQGAVEFERVSFSYDRDPVLLDVDLSIAPGERVVITGPNGAGKSTLLNLLLGLYRPQSGRLLLDGIALDELDLSRIRPQIGIVLQDPVIFRGTIRENIAYAAPEVSQAVLERAAHIATAAEFVEALPAGYETEVGDEGELLSGGQRQRIAMARALLGDPAVLVLDEPTTYLDRSAIATFLERLDQLASAPTVLMVTHSDRVTAYGGRVISLSEARITADRAALRAAP